MYTRANVYANGGDFSDPVILWYARGVAAMQKLSLSERTSWGFYAAIHGYDANVWDGVNIPSTPIASPDDQTTYWQQCQHGSWYFCPWHRGYLLGLEAIIRSYVVAGGGPSNWALPFWNYFGQGENQLPPAFSSTTWPDGGLNPLYTAERYGPNGDGNVFVSTGTGPNDANQDALGLSYFSGRTKASPGFGGLDGGFSHRGSDHGALEQEPHDDVHGQVGGQQGNDPNGIVGWMSDPTTAAFDPIFYLHHANIDRLWAVWNSIAAANTDPTDSRWVNGPALVGDRKFIVPLPDGSDYVYTPAMVATTTALGYQYSEMSAPVTRATFSLASRLSTLGINAPAALPEPTSMDLNAELVGATRSAVSLEGSDVSATVSMDSEVRARVARSLNAVTASAPEPDRVYLHLEGIRGRSDAARIAVYVGVPLGSKPSDHPERLAGNRALFGLRESSEVDGSHAGHGLNLVFDITGIVDQMHLSRAFDSDQLQVRIVPSRPLTKSDQITIGRISVYREGY